MARGRASRRDCLISRGKSDKVAILCLTVPFAKVLFKVLVKTEVLKINQVKHGDRLILGTQLLTHPNPTRSMAAAKLSSPRQSRCCQSSDT